MAAVHDASGRHHSLSARLTIQTTKIAATRKATIVTPIDTPQKPCFRGLTYAYFLTPYIIKSRRPHLRRFPRFKAETNPPVAMRVGGGTFLACPKFTSGQ